MITKKILVLVVLVCLLSLPALAQVRLIKLDQLEQRLAKGKDTTFVVNLWATWCGPCIEELPYFNKLQQAYASKKVKVLLISLDFKSKLTTAVIPFVKKMKLKPEVYLLDEANQQVYIDRIDKRWSGALPATLFINSSKKRRIFYEKEFTYPELVTNLASVIK